jgi:hypothetical protein
MKKPIFRHNNKFGEINMLGVEEFGQKFTMLANNSIEYNRDSCIH